MRYFHEYSQALLTKLYCIHCITGAVYLEKTLEDSLFLFLFLFFYLNGLVANELFSTPFGRQTPPRRSKFEVFLILEYIIMLMQD